MPELKKNKKYGLSAMRYDEVSLVDSGGDQDAHVLLFKRDTPTSDMLSDNAVKKAILNPEDVHTPVPLTVKQCKKCGRDKAKCNCVHKAARKTKQARDHNGRWVSTGSAVRGTANAKGFFLIRKNGVENRFYPGSDELKSMKRR